MLKCHTALWLLGWEKGQPLIRQLQCEKQRSVCTISSMSVDEEGICVGLGSSGAKLWNQVLFFGPFCGSEYWGFSLLKI